MEMTEDEIVWRYKKSGCNSKQITVLADLNATNRETIRDILDDHGVLKKKGTVSKVETKKSVKKGLSKEDVEEIKALARGEKELVRPEEIREIPVIPETIRRILEQDIITINRYIQDLENQRNEIECYLGWHDVDQKMEIRLQGQQA